MIRKKHSSASNRPHSEDGEYYQRERLVSGGERVHRNQTAFDDTHVQCVHTFEAAQHALGVGGALAGTAERRTRDRIVKLADGSGWHTTAANPGVEVAARTLGAFSTIGFEPSDEYLEAYESAAATIPHALARPRPARA